MEKIKINFLGFWPTFRPENSLFVRLLRRHFQVEICDDPDYLFCSVFLDYPDYCGFDGVRIFYSGENCSPDFLLFDYCIGFDHLHYGDRFFRLPMWLTEPGVEALDKRRDTGGLLAGKDLFCNFIYSHPSENGCREEALSVLQQYRRVESAGTLLNNMPGGAVAQNKARPDDYAPKRALQSRCKFSIAFESTGIPGFCTEKIIHAFEARTIPIYYGDPTVADTFNEAAFVNCHRFESMEAVRRRVEEIDQNDALFLEMAGQPVFAQPGYAASTLAAFEAFLVGIFRQPLPAAYRRSRVFWPAIINDRLWAYARQGHQAAAAAGAPAPRGGLLRRAWRTARQNGLRSAAAKVLRRLNPRAK